MAAVVPPKPAAGAMVDAAWGSDIHDRVYQPSGIVATGTATDVISGAATDLKMENINSGDPDWLTGDGINLQCPPGKDGWYDVYATVSIANGPPNGTPVRLGILRAGAFLVGSSGCIINGMTSFVQAIGYFQMSEGNSLRLQMHSGVTCIATVTRCSVIRRSHGGVAPGLLEPEAHDGQGNN